MWLRRAPGFIHACAHPVLSVVQYEMDKAAGRTNDEDSTRKKAKTTLDKYIHYFDRYINHDRARKIAIRSLPDIEMGMAMLQSARGYKLSDVTFIRGACRPGKAWGVQCARANSLPWCGAIGCECVQRRRSKSSSAGRC